MPYDYYSYNPYRYDKQLLDGISQFDFSAPPTDSSLTDGQKSQSYLKNFWENDENKLATANLGLGVLGTIGNNLQYNREYKDNMRRRVDEYTQIPYDRNSYRSYATDFYQSYQTGGEVTDLWNHSDYTTESNKDDDPFSLIDEMFKDYPQEDYVQEDQNQEYVPQSKTIFPVVDKLKQMGLNPSSVNTGHHNVGSLHGQNRAVDLGLNTTFGGDTQKMEEFKNWFDTQGNKYFPGVELHDERVRPNGQKVWSASHFHLQI